MRNQELFFSILGTTHFDVSHDYLGNLTVVSKRSGSLLATLTPNRKVISFTGAGKSEKKEVLRYLRDSGMIGNSIKQRRY